MKKMLLLLALIVAPAWAVDTPAKPSAASSAGQAAQEPSAAQPAPKPKAKKAKKAKAKKKAAASAAPATALSCQLQVCSGVSGCFLSKCGNACLSC